MEIKLNKVYEVREDIEFWKGFKDRYVKVFFKNKKYVSFSWLHSGEPSAITREKFEKDFVLYEKDLVKSISDDI